ncbi:uncharacterized protein LOC120355504 [Nilaparvata lugens]|uniref:uncharacterized protein LOC120355504 n=1 Tax=Nilaparvata lugens TaxID=108931 RepID=UPI00193CDB2B|nr:uncharacterized protein LOC120355504 [Nilaparvata lugens]
MSVIGISVFSIVFVCLSRNFVSAEDQSQPPHNETIGKFLSNSWKLCSSATSVSLCVKQRSLLAFERLSQSNDEIVFPGELISLVKTNGYVADQNSHQVSEQDLRRHLPKDERLQEQTLNILLQSAYKRFLSSRSLQIRLPSAYNLLTSEGRGDKKKGGNGAMMGAMMAACMMIPFALAGIGMIAGKALMTSMLALMLSVLMGSRRSNDSHGSSYEVISLPASGSHHALHARNLILPTDLPYQGSQPHQSDVPQLLSKSK